jgi:hypothetical protein
MNRPVAALVLCLVLFTFLSMFLSVRWVNSGVDQKQLLYSDFVKHPGSESSRVHPMHIGSSSIGLQDLKIEYETDELCSGCRFEPSAIPKSSAAKRE